MTKPGFIGPVTKEAVMARAAEENVELPDDLAEMITASQDPYGLLVRVLAYSALTGDEPTIVMGLELLQTKRTH